MTKVFSVLGDTSSHGSRGDLDTIVVCFWCLSTVASTGLISRFRYGLKSGLDCGTADGTGNSISVVVDERPDQIDSLVFTWLR